MNDACGSLCYRASQSVQFGSRGRGLLLDGKLKFDITDAFTMEKKARAPKRRDFVTDRAVQFTKT